MFFALSIHSPITLSFPLNFYACHSYCVNQHAQTFLILLPCEDRTHFFTQTFATYTTYESTYEPYLYKPKHGRLSSRDGARVLLVSYRGVRESRDVSAHDQCIVLTYAQCTGFGHLELLDCPGTYH